MKKTKAIYGSAPVDLGFIDLNPHEMMFWLYCPIKLADTESVVIPENLEWTREIIYTARSDAGEKWRESYAYVTAKTLWATPENPGNRAGWHSDGFLTNDLNYIWCDANPTVFYENENLHSFSEDHVVSLDEMERLCETDPDRQTTYPVKHLLRLDQSVLHKVSTDIFEGVRTFVKVSVSDKKYALKGNSINHKLNLNWDYGDRKSVRNCPVG